MVDWTQEEANTVFLCISLGRWESTKSPRITNTIGFLKQLETIIRLISPFTWLDKLRLERDARDMLQQFEEFEREKDHEKWEWKNYVAFQGVKNLDVE